MAEKFFKVYVSMDTDEDLSSTRTRVGMEAALSEWFDGAPTHVYGLTGLTPEDAKLLEDRLLKGE